MGTTAKLESRALKMADNARQAGDFRTLRSLVFEARVLMDEAQRCGAAPARIESILRRLCFPAAQVAAQAWTAYSSETSPAARQLALADARAAFDLALRGLDAVKSFFAQQEPDEFNPVRDDLALAQDILPLFAAAAQGWPS